MRFSLSKKEAQMIENYRGYKNGKDKIPLIDKYRPKIFEDFIGNEDVIKLLKNILTQKSTHTFLFTGPIGCGKTTLARITGKTIGATVKGSNSFFEILESNMADDRGIDFIRKRILENFFAEKRIYIFDEAHKLTKDAQDAGLKLFEEPPPSKYFIFCTNEPNKITNALKSRCSIHELSPLLPNETLKLLRRVNCTKFIGTDFYNER
jgi:DNA polymerase-3 subunit gamma/tau